MMHLFAFATILLTTVFIPCLAFALFSLQQNLAVAKRSGFRYTVVPISVTNKFWFSTQGLLLPFLDRLPPSWTKSWLPLSVFDRIWDHGYEPFEHFGSSTVLVVSPFRLVLWTCSPVAVVDIMRRQDDFPKPVEDLQILNVHGPTVTATGGSEGKRYRKISTGAFGQNTFERAWYDSTRRAESLVKNLVSLSERWEGLDLKRRLEVVTFGVVSEVCFGVGVSENGQRLGAGGGQKVEEMGHDISYCEAFALSAEYMAVNYITPQWLLKYSPLPIHKTTWKSHLEWISYMEEMIDAKRLEYMASTDFPRSNLLDSLFSASIDSTEPIDHAAILGNIWVFILGGFHTSANTLHFILILLAMHPEIQRTLQDSIDGILGERDPSTWSYLSDFPVLLRSHVGAVIAETNRLFGVLPLIPKCTGASSQPLLVDDVQGEPVISHVPANTLVFVNTSALHRNPNFWSAGSDRTEGEEWPSAASLWNPWRWLNGDWKQTGGAEENEGSSFFTPREGTYLPFSEGARSCIGKRFAQTELCAVLSRLMKECSVELKFEGSGEQDWRRARAKASKTLSSNMGFTLALELRKEVPLVFVRR